MDGDFSHTHYPLGIQCGRGLWTELHLSDQLSKTPPPHRSYLLHLIADHLRPRGTDTLSASELELWATLNQVLRHIGRHYLSSRQCRFSRTRLQTLVAETELQQLERLLKTYLELFPVLPVARKALSPENFLEQLETEGQLTDLFLELTLLRIQGQNPALNRGRQLFENEEQQLQQATGYQQQLEQIDRLFPDVDDGFADQPNSLLARLLKPLLSTNTLRQQLEQLQKTWLSILPTELLARITGAFALHDREGHIPGFPGEPDTTPLDPAAHLDAEYADYTIDLDWMPRAVLLAKSIFVWLHQLSGKYQRQIQRLDQIPDEELHEIAGQGFTSLWLIGIWQRSKASLKIKQLCGQIQVAASAYAIHDYRVADELGGDPALENLRTRCHHFGIDLACDVVTNHTGIDSVWVKQHPDWFIQLHHPPYPGYRFTGPDLSEDDEFAVQIEDGYYNHSEAAVVCRYSNRNSGEVRFFYHGNDGTHLPWNDTAQLNYLLPEVREAMIRLIIQVARRFRVIRFDAAMTLAKKHFQRLWFPLPGGGAGVPSRADHALSQEEFNRHFPKEFWRELVDRVREEAPDTLLIAEAFWLMEGYFVRTLGMHRVYNSAFMNMLKHEENEKYRQTLKNILAFDPAILQRFVNFMSNPDEKPASEQFGKEDKYFCVATLLATMPGLPMFGHGQIEGYHEKYGMEYLQPRWQEQADQHLKWQHEQRIFPLLRKRALFSGAEHFQLYDFTSDYGVEENVFVYSNRLGERTTLTVCNNSPHHISGQIGQCVARADDRQQSLRHACQLDTQSDFTLLTDLSSGQQHLQPTAALLHGGSFILPAYAHHVFTDFQPLIDHDGRWQTLWERYGMSGRKNLNTDFEIILLEPVTQLCRQLLDISSPEQAGKKIRALSEELLAELKTSRLSELAEDDLLALIVGANLDSPVDKHSLNLPWLREKLLASNMLTPASCFPLLDRLYNRREWRKLLKCNYYNEVDWFNQEAFGHLLLSFFQFLIYHSHNRSHPNFDEFQIIINHLLINTSRLTVSAAKAGYQVDNFLHSLQDVRTDEHELIPATGGENAMKILFVTPEATPFAKTGGLADVAGSLPRALRQLGHDVRVILPLHQSAEQSGISLRKGRKSVEVNLSGTSYRGSLKQAVCDGVPIWFIDCPEFFDRDPLYGDQNGDYPDNSLRFGFFCRAVLEMIKRLDFRPDVIHVNDWQTSFIPALLRTELRYNPFYSSIGTLLTIHNLGYQGTFPMEMAQEIDLDASLTTAKGMEYYGQLSMLKGGINSADVINTVSPTYCEEIQGSEQGHGFDGILRDRSSDLYGIINGLDRHLWDPALDAALPTPFNADNLNGKRACKRLLQKELGLELRHDVPIVALISRLDQQKGINLVEDIWDQLLSRDLQFILLGSGSQEAMEFWQEQQGKHPERVSINLGFSEPLSRRIYAASDLLLVPSRYEPCGLTQMIALHYGALPVVRKTGGLADTVIDVTDNPRQGYGFVFENSVATELLSSIDRALAIYPQRSRWLTLVKRGMTTDFSWSKSAEQYLELYTKARNYRQMPAA